MSYEYFINLEKNEEEFFYSFRDEPCAVYKGCEEVLFCDPTINGTCTYDVRLKKEGKNLVLQVNNKSRNILAIFQAALKEIKYSIREEDDEEEIPLEMAFRLKQSR